MSESIPTSNASFAHRRSRADSTTSFTYFQEDEQQTTWDDNEVVLDISDDDEHVFAEPDSMDEPRETSPRRRKSSTFSRVSVEDPLLDRCESAATNASAYGRGGRVSQKLYILTEDLTIVVAGFRNSSLGFAVYALLCTCTLGAGWLILRWLPRWRVALVGTPTPLRECQWVVIEVSPIFQFLSLKEGLTRNRINGANSPCTRSSDADTAGRFRQSLDLERSLMTGSTTRTMTRSSPTCTS